MPFGLTNAPAVFQGLVNDVLRDMLDRFVFVYLDDILICSRNLEEHRQHVRLVLNLLLENSLFVKAGKMRIPCQDRGFPGVHWGRGFHPDGPRQGISCLRLARPREPQTATTVFGVRELLSAFHP